MAQEKLLNGTLASIFVVLLVSVPAFSQDWPTVQVVQHKDYQTVNTSGGSTYSGGFPLRLHGVVLNNTEDWLDPTAAYDSEVHLWQMGGQAEFYVQSLSASTLAKLGVEYYVPGDFSGTACWMGQNYGNHIWHQDSSFNYTDQEWHDELDRLGLYGGPNVTTPLRAGDLVEIRARIGLHYKGKMNVNENHDKNSTFDFDIVVLDRGFGLPSPTVITLSAIKDAGDNCIFDDTRATGGEHYQSTLVEIQNVKFTADSIAKWGCDSDLMLEDTTGRTLPVHLGLNGDFDTTSAPTGYFDVIGIMDQSSSSGTNGYQLLVMNPADVPEPTSVTVMLLGAIAMFRRRKR